MPAVIGRTAGGLSYEQVLGLVEGVAAKARIVGFDMVEFMPERDMDGQGAMLAAQLLAAVLGGHRAAGLDRVRSRCMSPSAFSVSFCVSWGGRARPVAQGVGLILRKRNGLRVCALR